MAKLPCQDNCGKMADIGNGKWGRCGDCYDSNMIEIYRIEWEASK